MWRNVVMLHFCILHFVVLHTVNVAGESVLPTITSLLSLHLLVYIWRLLLIEAGLVGVWGSLAGNHLTP